MSQGLLSDIQILNRLLLVIDHQSLMIKRFSETENLLKVISFFDN